MGMLSYLVEMPTLEVPPLLGKEIRIKTVINRSNTWLCIFKTSDLTNIHTEGDTMFEAQEKIQKKLKELGYTGRYVLEHPKRIYPGFNSRVQQYDKF